MKDILLKLADGNPGALQFLLAIAGRMDIDVRYSKALAIAEILNIRGSNLYILWNDICERNTELTVFVLLAADDSIINADVLIDACSRQDRSGRDMIDITKVIEHYLTD